MLKFPIKITFGERDEKWVSKLAKSVRKTELGLGGRYTVAMMVGIGPVS